MKIKMISIAQQDGCAFVIKDECLYLLRYPYQSCDLIEASKDDLVNAVHRYGFIECDEEFNNLSETVNFLKIKYAEYIEKERASLPGKEHLKSLFHYATDEILSKYLDRVENELIPQRKLDAAESIALELLRVEKVIKNENMHNRALNIINRCKEERNHLKNIILLKERDLLKEFPNSIKKYTEKGIMELKKYFFKKGQLLPVGT
jgi:hypothetical protein